MDFLEQALIYCSMGFKIIPLKPMSKEAFTPHGVYDATDNLEQIKEWASQISSANMGLGCGPESGVCVLDVDKHHGGDKKLADLIKKNGDFPKCPMSLTPRGGNHLFFAYDKRVGNSVGSKTSGLGIGLDVKSKGGYVVLPPSYWDGMTKGKKVCEGGEYRWVRAPRGNNLPMMPEWMITKLMPKPIPAFSQRQIDRSDASIEEIESALKFINNENYGTWVKIGMAIHSKFGDAGFDLWLNWSGNGYANFSVKECERKWRSFKRNTGVSIASVFYEARISGADLSKIFKESKAA